MFAQNLHDTAVGGKVASTVYEGQKRFAILVRFPEDRRSDSAALERLLVPSPLGYSVPLGDLATVLAVVLEQAALLYHMVSHFRQFEVLDVSGDTVNEILELTDCG